MLAEAAQGIASGQVTGGSANIVAGDKRVDVHQNSNRAVIDWRQLDVARGETLQFHQPSVNSVVLNRVNDVKASEIRGSLKANGNVMILNPNGVLFGKNAQVDVGGLLATTSRIDNDSFMAGQYDFTPGGKADAAIINKGRITARQAGLVGLVAPRVENHGVITAKLGKVQLASADRFGVDLYGDGLLHIAASDALVKQSITNTGQIEAAGGQIALTAAAGKSLVDSLITVSGEMKAVSVSQREGRIVIAAEGSNAVAGNKASDKGRKQGASTVLISGKLAANGNSSGAKGGTVKVTGDHIGVASTARIDASGETGGGTVRVGGEYLGLGTTPVADQLVVQDGAAINASATRDGDGGEVILFSDTRTEFGGSILANGAGASGNGGFVETSGKNELESYGSVDANAGGALGDAGTWLLDPSNITIGTTAGITATGTNPITFSGASGGTNVQASTINTALGNGTSVIVQTGSTAAGGNGDITVSSAINAFTGSNVAGGSLTLSAYRNIIVNNTITLNNGSLLLQSNTSNLNAGAIDINNAIATNGGNITLGGGNGTVISGTGYAYGQGSLLYGVNINANVSANGASRGGEIVVNGRGLNTTTAFSGGINVEGGNLTTSHNGAIRLTGIGGSGTGTQSRGVRIVGNIVRTVDGVLTIFGLGGGSGSSSANFGVLIANAGAQVTSSAGDISIIANGGSGTGGGNTGLSLNNTATGINTTTTGNITITGTRGTAGTAAAADIDIPLANGVRTAGTAGNITLNANSLSLNTANNVNSVGTITVAPRTAITMGIGTGSEAFQLTNTQLGYLNAGTGYIFGSSAAGNLSVNTTTDFGARNLTFLSGGNITLAGNLAKTSSASTVNYLFQSVGNIVLNSGISATTGLVDLNLNAGGHISGSSSGTIATNGGLVTANVGSGSGSLAGIISGTGGLTKTGAGTLSLTAANTYSGATTVSAGTLVADIGTGESGTHNGISTSAANIASGATLRMNNQKTTDITQTISNTFSGSGDLEFVFANGTSGRNTDANGLDGFTGNLSLAKGASATADKLRLGSNVGGSITIADGTTLFVTGANRTVTGGISVTGAGNSEGRGAIRVEGNRTLNSNIDLTGNTSIGGNSNTGTINGSISGAFNVTKVGNSTLTLSGSNTYGGTTTVTSGTLQVGDGGTTGTLGAGAVTNNAMLNFNRSDAITVANAISGSGAVTKTGAGTLTLSGNNSYSGATTINEGTLRLGAADRISDSSALTIDASGTLDLNSFYETLASITNNGSVIMGSGNMLTTMGAQTHTGTISGGSVTLSSTGGGAITANNTLNDFTGTLAVSTTGTASVVDANALTLGTVSASTFSAQALGGNLTLGGNITTTGAGDAIVLSTSQTFSNAGNHTLTPGTGRYLIFNGDSASASINKGSTLSGFNRYGCTYNAGSPSCAAGTDIPATGSGFYFAHAPTLSITGITGTNKIYDGNDTATVNGTPTASGLLYTDAVTVDDSSAIYHFADEIVGNSKAITASGFALSGTNLGYLLSQPAALSADITPRTLTLSGLAASDKLYDATTDATITGTGSLNNTISGDDVDFSFTDADFTSANAGNTIAVTLNSLGLTGTDATNYMLSAPTLSADISKRMLEVRANDISITAGDTPTYSFLYNAPSGFATGENISNIGLSGTPNVTSPATPASLGAGSYDIVLDVSGLSAANYQFGEAATRGALSVTAGIVPPPNQTPTPPTMPTLPQTPTTPSIPPTMPIVPPGVAPSVFDILPNTVRQVSQGLNIDNKGVKLLSTLNQTNENITVAAPSEDGTGSFKEDQSSDEPFSRLNGILYIHPTLVKLFKLSSKIKL